MARNDLRYIINHVFLPPKLPQQDDHDLELDVALLNEVHAGLTGFLSLANAGRLKCWRTCLKMLTSMLVFYNGKTFLEPKILKDKLQQMEVGDMVALQIRCQNAGLLIRRLPAEYIFESFELSPTAAATIQSRGRLQRAFPGPTVAVSADHVKDTSFLGSLVEMLVKLDSETPEEAYSHITKANSEVREIRDSVHPRFVTQLLTGILGATGRRVDVKQIHKNTRDDVLWNDALSPWRRSPLWLLLRVAIQTSTAQDESPVDFEYKSFMLFFMSEVLRKSLHESLPSHLIFVMTAKISCRAMKLNPSVERSWMTRVQSVVGAAHDALESRWKRIEEDPDPSGTQSSWHKLGDPTYCDTQLRLGCLRPYLAKVQERVVGRHSSTSFVPDCPTRIVQTNVTLPSIGPGRTFSAKETRLNLMDFELWVEEHLQTWLAVSDQRPECCGVLVQRVRDYSSIAAPEYGGSPEELSTMILTIMELCVAADRSATFHHPLLCEYSLGLPSKVLQPLLLPKKAHMQRLSRIEEYLSGREASVVQRQTSIFGSPNKQNSLSVRYYEQSPSLQERRREIESFASRERQQKIAELANKRQEYNDRLSQSWDMGCEYRDVRRRRRGTVSEHSPQCKKCSLTNLANAMTIKLHEWPLPNSDLEAKATVFELDVPPIIRDWRDMLCILADLLSTSCNDRSVGQGRRQPSKKYLLKDYEGLRRFMPERSGRVQLASASKSFLVAHYRSIKVGGANETSVCVNNGMNYSLYDTKLESWTGDIFKACDIRDQCTFQLPQGTYKSLQFAVNDTIHTSNQIIADQATCPNGLTFHEYYAFSMLRSGHRLHWWNIVRELTAQVLNICCLETHLLLIQTAWQAGPPEGFSVWRETHDELRELHCGQLLLSAISNAFTTIEGNWQGTIAARTLCALTCRLLSLSPVHEIQVQCCQFLRRVRLTCRQWLVELDCKASEEMNDEASIELNQKIMEVMLTCLQSFDVETNHLLSMLMTSDGLATVFECLIKIYDHCPADITQLPESLQSLLRRHWRLSSRMESLLRNRVLRQPDELDHSIGKVWSGYRRGSPWTALRVPADRWLVAQTSGRDGASLSVHFDLLEGSLLVNGLPLTRLPHKYQTHATFQRLFGKSVFDVVPSTMPGMTFEVRDDFLDHRLHFHMHHLELIVRAVKGYNVWELIPAHALGDDLPNHLCQDFAHWLEVQTESIELRPLSTPWKSEPHNWWMRLSSDGAYRLIRKSKELIDHHSLPARSIATILAPLESANHLEITFDRQIESTEVHLPRLRLDFFRRKASALLESKQFPHLAVDPDQSLRTLTGLVNKLVLRRTDGDSRCVIIPHGEVSFDRTDEHVLVHIQRPATSNMYHLFIVDAHLGRLVDNGNRCSKFFRCYLHALTAHCMKDGLTDRTGTEEALSILSSSAVRSAHNISEAEIEILQLIASLTPCRSFYPAHLRVMQTVKWKDLSPLSQHPSYAGLAFRIHDECQHMDLLFHRDSVPSRWKRSIDQHLLSRSRIRDSTFHVYGFGAEEHSVHHDQQYDARDTARDIRKEHDVRCIAILVNQWSTNLTCSRRLIGEIDSWGGWLNGHTNVALPIGFDTKWLEPYKDLMARDWCNIRTAMSRCVEAKHKAELLFFLCTLAYSRSAQLEIVETFLAFATVPQLKEITFPTSDFYNLSDGSTADRSRLKALTNLHCLALEACPEATLPQLESESWAEWEDRQSETHESVAEEHVQAFVDEIMRQWPGINIRAPETGNFNVYISVSGVIESIRVLFQSWYRNYQLRRAISRTQAVLDTLHRSVPEQGYYPTASTPPQCMPLSRHLTVRGMFTRQAPTMVPAPSISCHVWIKTRVPEHIEEVQLTDLLRRVTSTKSSTYEQVYADGLAKSIGSLRNLRDYGLAVPLSMIKPMLDDHINACKTHFDATHEILLGCFRVEESFARRLASTAGMGPRLSKTAFFEHLAGSHGTVLPNDWKNALIVYGLALAELQRAERLLYHCTTGSVPELVNELVTLNERNWDPCEHPGWLAFEIENNISIRPVQAQVASELLSPSTGTNTVSQLNMGEGKSSVIVPIVAEALADGTKLVRIVVLRPLSQQMLLQLVTKLSGILGRRIYQMPITRSIAMDVQKARDIQAICKECMLTGGVLLVQPEHLLSFELMCSEQLASGDSELRTILEETQHWLDSNTRDILDESDEILSVRFELVYTMGTQQPIDLSPERWIVIQKLLDLVARCAEALHECFPQSLELLNGCSGSFPHLRILHHAIGLELQAAVAERICLAGLPGLPIWNLSSSVRNLIFEFLTNASVAPANFDALQNNVDREYTWKILLLLRGLLTGGVLVFAFQQKRWRVNYGLDLSRTMLAVPYHAKDCPAARAEFSHQDAAIILTCLAYYYGGLTDEQMMMAFEKLLATDYAQEEYASWVKGVEDLPPPFRLLSNVNLSDLGQCLHVTFPRLKYSKGVIDFYLIQFVFPKEMREFPQKLSASGWDIARKKPHPTTGFSGTNDSRHILPLSIDQCDLPSQLPTNALVLKWILRPENNFQRVVRNALTERFDAPTLLNFIVAARPPIRVVLDVGAQVLEWQNEEVARQWLSRTLASHAQAVVFFNDHGELSVLDRDEMVESFMTSPFAGQMDQCLIYLDEAHTRGTDLRLPIDYRAAVTLGPDLTKDRLMQACMRMRKLGRGQTVSFISPPEIEQRILQVNGKEDSATIETIDVLKWSMGETCTSMRKSIPLWAVQGLRCQRRHMAWLKLDSSHNEGLPAEAAALLLEAEAVSIEERYGPGRRSNDEDILLHAVHDATLSTRWDQVEAIRTKCRQFQLESFHSAAMQEEQERELSPENEREREVAHPPKVLPKTHAVHPDVERFAQTGAIDKSCAFLSAFDLFANTSAGPLSKCGNWPSDVLITVDFARTVCFSKTGLLDSFLRPVNWIARAATGRGHALVVLSPWEAHHLLPSIRRSKNVTLHTYSARVNISVPDSGQLSLCSTSHSPPTPTSRHAAMLLNLFAGQLYLANYSAYHSLCDFLGLCTEPPPDIVTIGPDGFADPGTRSRLPAMAMSQSPFKSSPVPFLRRIVTLRRKGQIAKHSHIGRLLNGDLLTSEDFEASHCD